MRTRFIGVAALLSCAMVGAEPNSDAIEGKLPQLQTQADAANSCQQDGIIAPTRYGMSLVTLNYFGTSISINIYDNGEADSRKALCDSLTVIKRLHQLGSDYNTYEGLTNVKSINNAPTQLHQIEPELVEMIAAGLEWHKLSNGHFNIAIGPVVQVWRGYRNRCNKGDDCQLPTETELNQAARFTDISKIQLNRANNTITMAEGMSIDLGGIAKGWMAEKVRDQLVEAGVNSFVINAGGNIRHHGLHPEGRMFVTAIEDPICKKHQFERQGCDQFENQFHEFIAGDNLTIVSSGNYLKYFTVDGKDYHHIIDPQTNAPKRTGVSASVVMNGHHIFADVLSTTLFLMPQKEALEFAESLPHVEAVWYLDEQGTKVTTSGFAKYRAEVLP